LKNESMNNLEQAKVTFAPVNQAGLRMAVWET
jgi:hypothetical protein